MLSREEDHPYRLRRIDLRNFKSVLDESVELGPLTVVVGANSSGKSTLLQSVLAVAQAVRQASSSSAFPLNGEYLSLGTYTEARNFRAPDQSEPMSIGFKLADHILHSPDLNLSTASTITPPEPTRPVPPYSDPAPESLMEGLLADIPIVDFDVPSMPAGPYPSFIELDWSLEFGESSNPQSGFAKIQRVEFTATVSYLDVEELLSFFTLDSGLLDELEEVDLSDDPVRWVRHQSKKAPRIQTRETTRITNRQAVKGSVEESVVEINALELKGGLPSKVLTLPARSSAGTDLEVPAGDRWVGDVLYTIEFAARDLFGAEGCAEFKYLGPLREPPRTHHGRGSTGTYLGNNGQFAAIVLHEFADRLVKVPLPDGQVREVKLRAALNQWIQSLGLADGVSVEDHGRHGLALKVRREGTTAEVDLTSVGVGVSQALPVILMCLLSDSGDMLIFEQPELHLHPATQQRMADLLLAFAATGRQILVETHSEHLVNRLRYQVASDDTDRAASLIKLLFAEQTEGITSYRESTINEYGGVSEDWPEGFFDISARSAQDLVRAHLHKRQRAQDSS